MPLPETQFGSNTEISRHRMPLFLKLGLVSLAAFAAGEFGALTHHPLFEDISSSVAIVTLIGAVTVGPETEVNTEVSELD